MIGRYSQLGTKAEWKGNNTHGKGLSWGTKSIDSSS